MVRHSAVTIRCQTVILSPELCVNVPPISCLFVPSAGSDDEELCNTRREFPTSDRYLLAVQNVTRLFPPPPLSPADCFSSHSPSLSLPPPSLLPAVTRTLTLEEAFTCLIAQPFISRTPLISSLRSPVLPHPPMIPTKWR
jgi:hypothetical protein